MPYTYEYPKADNTTDAVVFGLDIENRSLKVLLIERGREKEPFYGSWALPGGFIRMDEDLDTSVKRELEEETGLQLAYLEQLATFGKPGRDPRGRVISVAYWAIVRPDQVTVEGRDDAKQAKWFDVADLPSLAFDHKDILDLALQRLRGKLSWCPVGVWLLPEQFTLSELRTVYEIILGREIDRGNFRKKMHGYLGGLLPSVGQRRLSSGRPAAIYTFDPKAYADLVQKGHYFEG